MTRAVEEFNEQLEKLAELAIVLIIGAMLPHAVPETMAWWFIPVLFIGVRPLAVLAGTLGKPLPGLQRAMISWFGIRGIGSIFYLMFALHHGVDEGLAHHLTTLTLLTVAASILVHGITVQPVMAWYARYKSGRV